MNCFAIDRLLILVPLVLALGCSEERRITTQSAKALEFYTTGVSQWEKFYYSEALRAFDEAIRLDSSFAMAWARRAVLDEGTQNSIRARIGIARAVTLLPLVTKYEQMFIRLQSYKLNYSNQQAMDLADSMILLYPQEKEVHLIRGNLYEFDKNLEDAIRSYRRAIKVDTSYALAVMSLGYAYSTIGEQEKAVEQMERYIRLAPEAADPRASFADILLRVGRYDEALNQYQQSLALKPDYWYSMTQIGLIYLLKGRLKVANEQFHKGFASLPESPQLKAIRFAVDGNMNLLRGQYKESTRQYEEALQLDSSNIEAAFGLVNAFRNLHEFKRADEVLKSIFMEFEHRNLLQSQFMRGYNLAKSKLLLDQGEYQNARALCDSALEFSTAFTRGPVFQQIAEINIREKQYEDAFDACEEALRVNPNYPDALLTLVKAYHSKGDAAMTWEVGSRLLEFWKNADPDFLSLHDLQALLGTKHAVPAPRSSSPRMIAAAVRTSSVAFR
jgi:tetratricopeptide (TPR) repeat protein